MSGRLEACGVGLRVGVLLSLLQCLRINEMVFCP